MAKRRAKGEGTIFQRKDGLWQGAVIFTDLQGQKKRRMVYGKTQSETRAKLDALRKQHFEGLLTSTDLTVEAYLNQWLKEKEREIKHHTVADYRYLLTKYVIPRIGNLKLSNLTPLQIQGMCSDIADEISVARANKCRRVLAAALNQAVRWQLIMKNPADAVKPYREHKKEMCIWTLQEAAKFLATAKHHRLYALFYLAMSTGMRRGELLGLRWADLNGTGLRVNQTLLEQRGTLILSSPKTQKSRRYIALSPDVMRVLQEHKEKQQEVQKRANRAWSDSDYVFSTRVGTPISPRNLERTWYCLQAKAGVTRARLHDLRHFHASLAISKGTDAKLLADRLGHAKASFTLDVYTHLFEEQREKATVSIEELVESDDEDEDT